MFLFTVSLRKKLGEGKTNDILLRFQMVVALTGESALMKHPPIAAPVCSFKHVSVRSIGNGHFKEL